MSGECDPDYRITYYDHSGAVLKSPITPTTVSWARKLDEMSRASITYTISGDDCCEELGKLEAVVHEVGIFRNNLLVWYGWLERPEYHRDSVTITAVDALWWLGKRRIHNDHKWVNVDLTQIFAEIWQDAITDADPIRAFLTLDNTGTLQSRTALAAENRIAMSVVQEMLDTGLDVTTVGQNVFAGIAFNGKALQLRLDQLDGDPTVIKDGSQFATKVIVDAHESVVGIYPPGTGWAGSDFYPLVEEVIHDSQVQDVQSAFNAAKSRYEYTRYVPRIVNLRDGLQLNPNTEITVADLVAGRKMIVNTTGLCYNANEEFRIGTVDVDVAAGVETVRLGLQPKGPSGTLSNVDDAL